jgi:sugar phosphate isomerase/epimerase
VDHASRFVFSGPSSWPLEQAIRWAVEHGFRRVDFNADTRANQPATFTAERVALIRALAAEHGVDLGIHTSSAVNMAEITPVMADAADEYIRQNLDVAQTLGCSHVIAHGGYHFSSDVEARFAAGIERLALAARLAEERDVELHFENHNAEPEHAEIHYIPCDVAETRRFFGAVSSPSLRWACNVGHAMLVPDGFEGFLDAFGAEIIGHVRLHDTNGRYEEHFRPGEGIVDFRHVFRTLHERGYRGPFTLDFGAPEEKALWRDRWTALLDEISGAR